jgi:ring-1,2-phenylacetyl-CoA epoxidase subunit PaaE
VVEGKVDMDANYALEDYEVARGFALSCQSFPVTDRLVIDFDDAH